MSGHFGRPDDPIESTADRPGNGRAQLGEMGFTAFSTAYRRLRSAYLAAQQLSTTEAEQETWFRQHVRLRRFFDKADRTDELTARQWTAIVTAEIARVSAHIDAQIARRIA